MPDNNNEIRRIAHWQSIYSNNASGGLTDPSTIAGLKWWIDPSDGSTMQDVSSQPVSSGSGIYYVRDKSANSWDITTTNATLQATYQTSPTYLSQPVMTFDGVNQYIRRTTDTIVDQGNTMFIVWAYTGTPISTAIHFGSGTSNSVFLGQQDLSGGFSRQRTFAGSDGAFINYLQQNANMTAVEWNGASSKHYKNGSTTAEWTQNIGTNTSIGATLGATSTGALKVACEIGEILVYNSILSAENLSLVSAYLKSKWGIV